MKTFMTQGVHYVWRAIVPSFILLASCSSAAWAAVTDATRVITEPPLSLPSPGVTYNDPAFGTPTLRIGDPRTVDPQDPTLNMMVPEYSQLQAWNADMTLLLINGNLILDANTFTLRHKVDFRWPAWGNGLRWSPTDPLLLYYTGGDCTVGSGCMADDAGQQCGTESSRRATFRRYRLTLGSPLTARRELVRCFSEYTSFQKDASFEELSESGQYVALVGQRADGIYEAFAYDIPNNVKHTALALPVDPTFGPRFPDWAAMSPSGTFVLLQWGRGKERFRGLEAYDRNTMTYAGKVSTSSGHGDITKDASGNEFFIQTNANNADLLTDNHYIIKAKIPQGVLFDANGNVDRTATVSSGATVPLLQLDWFHGMHISCRNHRAPGWCVVSTISDPANGWQPFEDEIFKLFLNSSATSPRVERLAHHRSSDSAIAGRDSCSGVSNYWAQPHATVSPTGTKVIFGSNWRRICDPAQPVDAFQLNLSPADTLRPSPPTGLRIP